jgi:hypothetical protein
MQRTSGLGRLEPVVAATPASLLGERERLRDRSAMEKNCPYGTVRKVYRRPLWTAVE